LTPRARRYTRLATAVLAVAAGASRLAAQAPVGDTIARATAVGPAPLTIGEARDRAPDDADTITVAGRALVGSGVFQVRAFEIAIASPSGGLRVYSRTLRDTVAEGDSLHVTGVLRRYRGDLQIVASDVSVIPVARRRVAAVPVRLRARDAEARGGRLVRITGRVQAKGANDGGQWLRLEPAAEADSGTIDVWVSRSSVAGIDLAQYEPGELLEVTGIVLSFRDGPGDPVVWQLAPRDPRDIRIRGIPRRWYRGGALGALGALLLVGGLYAGARVNARRNAREVEEIEERYRQLLHLLPDAVVVHARGAILFTNPAAARLLGVNDERALVGQPLLRFLAPTSRPLAEGAPTDTPTDLTGVARARGQLVGADGTRVDVEIATGPCRYHDAPAMVMLARDITEQLRHEHDLHALALRDDLTGLHNRRGFTILAEQELARARRYGRSALLLFADLDGLKGINDEFGHAAGDEALRLMARALRSVVRESDVVARWGGDEFVALIFETEAPRAESIAARLNDALRRLAGEKLPFVASMSVGMTPLDPENVTDIVGAIARADADLYLRRQRSRALS
jgi:diguanylate cyclase (GGDEF)-like protein/PAS domain S-box-containing protein